MRHHFGNYCLLLALAFLQCLAPLLHAHAGGLHASSDAHVHFGAALAHPPAHVPELRADSCDLPVVGAASEFKRDPAADGLDGAPSRTVWLTAPHPAQAVAAAFSSGLSRIAFRPGPPPSQAPPARLSIS